MLGSAVRSPVGAVPPPFVPGRTFAPRRDQGPYRGLGPLPRDSLLESAADQQVQYPNDRQDAYYREHCDHPEEHS